MPVSYLPSVQNAKNSTLQTRRRVNQTVSAVDVAQSSISSLQSDTTQIQGSLAKGVSGVVSLAKLTGGGSNGSLTVTGGIITSIVEPT